MDRMNLKQLEAFVWVTKLGSFAAAASHLNTTQPTISARIQELEDWLGMPLFDRTARRAQLTAKGREALDYAERMIGLAGEMRRRGTAGAPLHGVVRLGAADNIALLWLPRLLSRLAREHPGVVVELIVGLSVHLCERLLAHELDIAFLVGPVPGPRIVTRPLCRIDVALMASPRFALPKPPLRPRDIAEFPLISHLRDSHLYVMTEAWFAADGVQPRPFHGCTSVATMIRLASEGVGLGVLPPNLVEREVAEGALRIYETAPPLGGFDHIVAHHATGAPPSTQIIADMAVEIAARECPAAAVAG